MSKSTNNDQVKNLIQIRKSLARGKAGNLAENQAFVDFLKIQAELSAEFDKTWDIVKARMEQYDIKKIEGSFGYITIAERTNYKATGNIAPKFMRQVLDTAKVSAFAKFNNKLPAGVSATTTKYLAKKITV